MRGTTFLWRAAGCPPPTETNGTPLRPRDWQAEIARAARRLRAQIEAARVADDLAAVHLAEREVAALSAAPTCACCAAPAEYLVDDAVSDNFTTVANESRVRPFGGASLCAGCTWCHRTIALRCALWIARPTGIWFQGTWSLKGLPTTRPRALDVLLDPPEPPFVVGYPLAGIDHGGEEALERTMLRPPEISPLILEIRETIGAAAETLIAARPSSVPVEEAKRTAFRALVAMQGMTPPPMPWRSPLDVAELYCRFGRYAHEPWWRWAAWPLIRLQSKHVAIFAKVSTSRTHYRVQVDDAGDFTLDVRLWRELRARADRLLADMRAQGVGARDATAALLTLQVPPRYRVTLPGWRAATASMRPHHESTWWPHFVSMLIPELAKVARRPQPENPVRG